MSGQRILLKLSGPNARLANGAGLALGGGNAGLRFLFDAPAGPGAGGSGLAAAGTPAAWHVATLPEGMGVGGSGPHPWDVAHGLMQDGVGLDGVTVEAAEPDLQQSWSPPPDPGGPALAAASTPGQGDGEKGAPFQSGGQFGWHLDPAHSGLRAANLTVGTAGDTVTIVHLDTGYDPAHQALPVNLDRTRQYNFVENTADATDQTPTGGLLRNRGHGTGTIGILAGGDATGLTSGLPVPVHFGPIGGAPMARVVPVRIANSVVEFWTSAVAQGIDYARRIGADVLSMSMGGLPSDAWADAVNAAYEAGVVLVCAAGNSFGGKPTSLVVYPARFDRVIAACGVMAQGAPYYGLSGGVMEGCAGPMSKMATALAASTPNIPWLRLGDPAVVDMDGAGTSAATPQVAAAAALWLAKNGARFPARDWRRVEAVRAALFGSGRLPPGAEPKPNRFFGQGTLDALGALEIVPDAATLRPTGVASASFGFLHLLSSWFGLGAGGDPREPLYRLEMTQLALTSPAAQTAVPDPGVEVGQAAARRFAQAILDEGKASQALQGYLAGMLGRAVPAGGPSAPPSLPASPAAVDPAPDGPSAARRVMIPRPNRRRLRIFATDPGDSRRLATSFINTATIEVPWEDIKPGPVGDYLEVVDVDPASNAAYPPVDLEDRYLLAQDGIAPSEGNPQFHQQMVYAVAMRTIRNFETALGRKALWSERMMPRAADGSFVTAPDDGFVRRLRIYPHALRQENAFYSPQRKALLFGYFNAKGGVSRGRQVVFTCLSHDIVAHETTHALLDGLHRRFQESTNPDVLAFHEAFADIVAIFQHFTFPELLRHELGRLRGDLSQASIMSDLARQFGRSLHNARALRQAITPGSDRDPNDEEDGPPLLDYRAVSEPHERGAVLVAAMFEAFNAIYTRRTQDLLRIGGIGQGAAGGAAGGAIHPDLVNRLANEAADTAQRVLTTAIRALDYMPPIDPTFGDYLRAIVTADADMEPDHGMGYRVAFAEAFARRSIYPDDVPSVSPDGLLWQTSVGPIQNTRLNEFLQKELKLAAYTQSDRREAFRAAKANAAKLHGWMAKTLDVAMARSIGLDLQPDANGVVPAFEVHSVRPALRTTLDGDQRSDIVATVTQERWLPLDPARAVSEDNRFLFRGGCTLLLDRNYGTPPIRYAICRPVWDAPRADLVRQHQFGAGPYGMDARYGSGDAEPGEPFAGLHAALAQAQ